MRGATSNGAVGSTSFCAPGQVASTEDIGNIVISAPQGGDQD